MKSTTETSTLKLHVDPRGSVWQLDGDRFPFCTGKDEHSVASRFSAMAPRVVRVLGTPENAGLVVALHKEKKSNPGLRIEVASPAACSVSSDLRNRPEQVLLDMTRWDGPPSLGGWHVVGEKEYPSYLLAAAYRKGYPLPALEPVLRTHLAWPAVSLIPHLDKWSVCGLLSHIIDPRFFVDRRAPDRSSRLKSYLGASPRTRREASLGGDAPVHWRWRTVLKCWLGEPPSKRDLAFEPYFLWRSYYGGKDPATGEVRASQRWLAFLRHTWLDSLYRGDAGGSFLFAPELFFLPREADWYSRAVEAAR